MALAGRDPDVVALQEVSARTAPMWAAALATIGLPHSRCSLAGADPGRLPASRRRTGVLLAARTPLADAGPPLEVPWPETALAARVDGVRVDTIHVPNAANGWVKPRTLAAIRAGARVEGEGGCRGSSAATSTRPGASTRTARWSRSRATRKSACAPSAGRSGTRPSSGVVPGLRDLGYADAFRALHGYAQREPSWTFRRIAGHSGGWRLDHLFASSDLHPAAACYHHAWREADLSDHAALEADLERR